jgi:hypothetical protein
VTIPTYQTVMSPPPVPLASVILEQASYPKLIGRTRQKILGLSMRNLEKQPRGSSVRFYQYPPIRIDTENLRKALSGL